MLSPTKIFSIIYIATSFDFVPNPPMTFRHLAVHGKVCALDTKQLLGIHLAIVAFVMAPTKRTEPESLFLKH